jgi:hypothetical protein
MPDDLMDAIHAEIRRLRPEGAEVIDVHTHLGLDEDGRSMALPDLLDLLDGAGAARACVFPLHDPERHPAYRIPNDRVLRWSSESGGRLIPFCRLDPSDDPLTEAERCLARGARGIKLHPRAQSFGFDDGIADGIFALAEQARVPVMIHAGRGMPPIAEGLAQVALRHPDLVLILAHGGIADQALLAHLLADHPGVLYDTSCFSALDVRTLLARVPAERVVFGSDPPYGEPVAGLFLALRACAAAGLDERRVRCVLGGTAAAVLDGTPLPVATDPVGPEALSLPAPLARVYANGALAFGAVMAGHPASAREGIELALGACRDPSPGRAGEALESIAPLLSRSAETVALPESVEEGVRMLFLAMALAVTWQGG